MEQPAPQPQQQFVVAPQAAPVRQPKTVASIKGHRRKQGELQYSVMYEGENTGKGHWIPATELTCTGIIEAYEESRKGQRKKTDQESQKKAVEIIGLVEQSFMPDGYVVRFSDSPKPQIATRAFLHKHASKLLMEFYETHLKFMEPEEKPKPRKKAAPEGEAEPEAAPEPAPAPPIE